ncbi:MAG: MarR family transcriptional regulator [Clostridia bacterium]|nr:MarR family transcriptional regulator [Clostridia bacterium]
MKTYTIFEEVRYINHLLSRRAVENNFAEVDKNLTRANAFIIKYLINNAEKDIFQKDIENKFGITKSTASTVLKLMEAKNLITRESILNDARYKKIVPTKKAYEIHEKIEQSYLKDQELLLSNFSYEEKETFKALLTKLKTNIKEITEKEKDKND